MGERDPEPRRCPMPGCGRILKEEERRCPICFPHQPTKKKAELTIHDEAWYCADCLNKIPPDFDECPICRTKTHRFCEDCGTLILIDQSCPICNGEETFEDGIPDWQITKPLGPLKGDLEETSEEELINAIESEDVKARIGRPPAKRQHASKDQLQVGAKRGRPKKAGATKGQVRSNGKKQDGRKFNCPPKARVKALESAEEDKTVQDYSGLDESEVPVDGYTESHSIEAPPEKLEMAILKLDLDGKNGLNQLCDRLWIIKYLGLKVEAVEIQHTVNGYHAVLQCDNMFKRWEILLFQTWLGSDFRREICNLLKIERGTENWNNLFKEKWKYNPLGQEVRVSQETFDQELSEKVLRLIQLGE